MSSATLDRVFFALSDATRRGMLRQLAKGEATVGQLAAPFDAAPATISGHLRVLEKAGLIRQTRDGKFLRTRLQPARLWRGLDWLKDLRSIWDGQLDAIEKLLEREGRRLE